MMPRPASPDKLAVMKELGVIDEETFQRNTMTYIDAYNVEKKTCLPACGTYIGVCDYHLLCLLIKYSTGEVFGSDDRRTRSWLKVVMVAREVRRKDLVRFQVTLNTFAMMCSLASSSVHRWRAVPRTVICKLASETQLIELPRPTIDVLALSR